MKPEDTKNPNKPIPLRITDIIPSTDSSSKVQAIDKDIIIPEFDLEKQFLSSMRKQSATDRKSPVERKKPQPEPLRPVAEASCQLGKPISHDKQYQSASKQIISEIVKRDIVRMQNAMQSKTI